MDLSVLSVGTTVNIKRSNGQCIVHAVIIYLISSSVAQQRSVFYVCSLSALVCTGRVHTAAVSGVDKETNYVSVEWYENDETKGKEVNTIQTL